MEVFNRAKQKMGAYEIIAGVQRHILLFLRPGSSTTHFMYEVYGAYFLAGYLANCMRSSWRESFLLSTTLQVKVSVIIIPEGCDANDIDVLISDYFLLMCLSMMTTGMRNLATRI